MNDNDLITVCSACVQASCWQGRFLCDDARHAGILQMTRKKLKAMRLEHPSYLKTDEELQK